MCEVTREEFQSIVTSLADAKAHREQITADLAATREELAATREELAQISQAQTSNADDMQQVIEAFRAAQGGFKVLTFMGRMAKPFAAVAAAAVAFMSLWEHIRRF